MIYNKKIDKKSLKYLTTNLDSIQTKSIFDISEVLVEDYHTFLQSKLTKESLDEILIKLGCGISQSFDALIINVESLKNSKIEDKIRFFYEVNRANFFGSSSYTLSVLLFNYLLIQDNELPIIMYPNIAKHIIQTFKETPIEVYKILIQKLINHSVSINKKQKKLELNQIKEAILSNKEELINLFGITELGIYGSYATNKVHEYSDIDFWIITNREIDLYQIKKLLEFIINHRVDVKLITQDERNKDNTYWLVQIF